MADWAVFLMEDNINETHSINFYQGIDSGRINTFSVELLSNVGINEIA